MKLSFSAQDERKWERLCETRAQNNLVTRIYSHYLNHTPRFLTADMVEDLARDCGISTEDAFCTMFSAALGLDSAENADHRRLERLYIREGVRLLDTSTYAEDPYLQTIRFPEAEIGKWRFTWESYAPYEPFVCGHPKLTDELQEIPQLGAFAKEFRFPAVLENGVEWMTVTPNEIETMRAPIAEAHGNAVTFGLGLGYFAFRASQKPSVETLTVVERDADVIELFRKRLLPQFPHREKIRILQADAFDYLKTDFRAQRFDTAFVDLWHDASDGLELYLRFKKLESLFPETSFSYWIEPSLLSCLRELVLQKITDPKDPSPRVIHTFDELSLLLSKEGLQTLAGGI